MNLRDSLCKFIPKTLFPLLKEGKNFKVIEGAILFADLAGFTKLTETLASIGKEGAEELTNILNSFFEKMIDIVISNKGDVIRFGGDAMTIFLPSSLDKAIQTSLLLQKECSTFQNVKMRGGVFSLGMKIGVSFGSVYVGILGDERTGFDYFAAGNTLDNAAEAEHHAQKGEIVVSPANAEMVSNSLFDYKTTSGGFVLVKGMKFPLESEWNLTQFEESSYPSEKQLLDFLPYYVKEKAFLEEQKLVGEHRRTTTLFLKFSNLDLSKAENLKKLRTIYAEIANIVKKFGGIINKVDMGDKGSKLLILFGSPISIENQEEHAVRCSLEIINSNALKELNVKINMGVTVSNLFSAYVGSKQRREFTVMGDGINLAARLMTVNMGKSILVNDEIFQKTKEIVEYQNFEPIFVKGKSEKINVFSPLFLKETIEKASSFVGRKKEIESALRVLESFEESPLLCITAPPGMGKSDFLLKLKEIIDEKGYESIYTRLAPYDREKFFTPLKNVISHSLQLTFTEQDSTKEIIYNSLPEQDKIFLPLFSDLFKFNLEDNLSTKSLSSKERKDIFFAIVSRILINALSEKPHFIFIDHLDYADPSTIEFLLFFSEDLQETKGKIIFSLRDDNLEHFKELIGKSRQIVIPPFSKNEVEDYLVKSEGFAPPAEFFLDFLLTKSGGNPKFLSELVSIIKSQNLAFVGPSGKYEVDEDRLSTTTFPDTLQGLFLSKVEGLSETDRSILRSASVLGTSFSIETLSSLTESPPEEIISKINSLEKTSLIKMDTWGKRPYASFSDNLLREALYNSLNFELRRELHLKVAKFLEKEGIASSRVFPVLARHYEYGGDDEKALYYLFESAKNAKVIYDYRSCYDYLFRYISIAEKKKLSLNDNEQYLDAFVMYAEVQQELGRISEAGLCFSKIVDEQKELSAKKIQVLSRLADNKRREGNLKESLEIYEKALEGAKQLKDESLQCTIFLYSGVPLAMSGKMGKAMDYFQRAELLAEKINDYPSLVYALMNRGLVEYFRGKLEGAKSFILRAKEVAANNNLRSHLALITVNLSQVFFESGDYIKALEICKEAEEVSRQFGYRNNLVMSMSNRALFETMLGNWNEAEKSVERALTSAKHYQMNYLVAVNMHIKSLLFYANGEISKSFSYQIEALKSCIETNHLSEAVGCLSEILSISNQLQKPDLASKIVEQNISKLQKEIENTSRTLTISFNAHYAFHKFLAEETDSCDTEEKLESILDRARESGILWLVAEVGNVVLKFYQILENHAKAVETGKDLFPLLSTHYCPLILPKFLLSLNKSLFDENQKEDLCSSLNCLLQYDKFLDRGLNGIEYNFLLYKIFESENIEESQRRLLTAQTITKKIEEKEEDQIFRDAFLNLPMIKELKEK